MRIIGESDERESAEKEAARPAGGDFALLTLALTLTCGQSAQSDDVVGRLESHVPAAECIGEALTTEGLGGGDHQRDGVGVAACNGVGVCVERLLAGGGNAQDDQPRVPLSCEGWV